MFCNRPSFALRKAAYRVAKDALLEAEKPSLEFSALRGMRQAELFLVARCLPCVFTERSFALSVGVCRHLKGKMKSFSQ